MQSLITRTTFSILVVIFGWTENQAFVAVASGLRLRSTPNGAILKTLPFGSVVKFLPQTKTEVTKISEFDGSWILVQADGVQGYVFDGFLLPFAPPQKCENLNTFLESDSTARIEYISLARNVAGDLVETGKRFVKMPNEPPPPEFVYVHHVQFEHRLGGTVTISGFLEIQVTEITFNKLRLQEAYLLLANCLPRVYRADFPTFSQMRSGRAFCLAKDSLSHSFSLKEKESKPIISTVALLGTIDNCKVIP